MARLGGSVLMACALVAAYLLSRLNYLLFHSLVEIFSVAISGGVFALAWSSRKKEEQGPFVFLGIAYLFVGLIDLFHALSYEGMGVFPPGVFYANQLWICARYLESLSLLCFVLLFGKSLKLRVGLAWSLYLALFAAVILTVFVFKVFPACFIAGKGQTPFKIASEYIICSVLLLAILLLRRKRAAFNHATYAFLQLSLATTILGEFCFTLYTDNFGLLNALGHLLKLLSFYLIYRSVIRAAIEEPLSVIYASLQRNNAEVSRLNDELRVRGGEIAGLLRELQAIFDHLPALVFYKDRENRFVKVNRQLAEAFGKPASELANASLYDLYPREVAERYHRDDLEVIESARPKMNFEESMQTKTGRRWLSTSKIPFVDEGGAITGVIGISEDITERREAEGKILALLQQKELILKEVHHRIKNNLSMVCSMLQMQAEESPDPAVKGPLLDASARIISMAELYDRLYRQEGYDHIDLADYLPNLIDHIAANFAGYAAVEVKSEIDHVTLAAKTAQALGVILNELMTNSFKYAFAGRGGGKIGVRVQGREGRVMVSFEDDGVGIPADLVLDGSAGFGLHLIDSMVRELGASLSIQRDKGTRISFDFPCAAGSPAP